MLGIYILHFEEPIFDVVAGSYGGPSHYVGISSNVGNRINKHRNGKGSVVTKIAKARGIEFKVGWRAHLPYMDQKVESAVTRECERFCRYCRGGEITMKIYCRHCGTEIEGGNICDSCAGE